MAPQAILRVLTVLAAAATILLSWPVWQVHTAPPTLPLLPLPQVPTGVALLAALALCLVAPLAGWCTYVVVLVYAILADQTRLQPELVTFAFFLAAGLPGAAGLTLARVYLVTMWFYAGLHKLLSVDFMTQSDTWMLRAMAGDPAPWLRALFPWTIVTAEIGIALLALVPRTRRVAVAGALLLHGGILASLVRADWNRAVWPWNLLCAVAGIFLILPWRRTLAEEWRAARPPVRLGALALAVYPLGFYAGVVDTYLSHSLYAQDQPRGYVCNLSGDPQPMRPGLGTSITYSHPEGPFDCREIFFTDLLGVPLPPLHRLFEGYFSRTCAEGEFLLILERRRFTPEDRRQRILTCSSSGQPVEVMPETRL